MHVVRSDADVRGVDVLVGGEGDGVAVLRAIHAVGQRADRDQVVRLVQRERVRGVEAFTGGDLLRDARDDRVGHEWAYSVKRRIARQTLWPPNPNELLRTTSTRRCTGLFGV